MSKQKILFQVATSEDVSENFEGYYRTLKVTGKKVTKGQVLKIIFDDFFKNPQNLAIANAGKNMDERLKEILSGKKTESKEKKEVDFGAGLFGLPEQKPKTDAGESEKEINLW